jgi:hypothetical protein
MYSGILTQTNKNSSIIVPANSVTFAATNTNLLNRRPYQTSAAVYR